MESTFSRDQALAVVEQSPRAVAAGDKAAWLGMFSRLAIVEDPVGSAPHISGVFDAYSGRRGNDALSRFYDTFIDGNSISFVCDRDFVVGKQVMRDLALQLEVNGMQATVPMHLMYDLAEEDGALKVQRLSAHWEFFPMSQQMMKSNVAGMAGYSVKLVRGLGLAGVMGFMRAVRSVGRNAKLSVHRFIQANNAGDAATAAALFDGNNQGVFWPANAHAMDAAEFVAVGTCISAKKLIVAGNRVSCSLEITLGDTRRAGVAVFDVNWKSRLFDKVSIYCDDANSV